MTPGWTSWLSRTGNSQKLNLFFIHVYRVWLMWVIPTRNFKIAPIIITSCSWFTFTGVDITLGNTEDFFSPKEQSLKIRCILNSGTLDNNLLRSWTKNSITLINSGIPTSAGIGYSESLGSDSFSLTTPVLDYSFDGSVYQCNYLFSQATLNLKIYRKWTLILLEIYLLYMYS